MKQVIDTYNYAKMIKEGIKVTLAGPPNAGKSSLMNMLVGSDCAIVSSIPGTTRDVLKVDMDLDGYKVILQDTAGLRETTDQIEMEGIKRAKTAVESSSVCLLLLDITSDVMSVLPSLLDSIQHQKLVLILNKTDLVSDSFQIDRIKNQIQQSFPVISGNLFNESCDYRYFSYFMFQQE